MILTIFLILVAIFAVANPTYAENSSIITDDTCNNSIQEDFTVSKFSNNFNSTGTKIMYSSESEEIDETSENDATLNEESSLDIGSAAGDTPAGGIYVHSGDMKYTNFTLLKKANINNIFLFDAAFNENQTALKNFLNEAKANSFNVHAWLSCFNEKGKYLDARNINIQNNLINKAVNYSKIDGVKGIHLYYLQYPGTAYDYPGGTGNITDFVIKMKNEIKAVNPNILLSAALMPEIESAKFYGQDYKELAKHLNILIPMVYEGDYNANNSWIENFVKYTVNQTKGTNATVWAALLTYKNYTDNTKLPYNDLVEDVISSLNGGAEGYVLFRHDNINSPSSLVEKSVFTKPFDFSNLNYAITSSDLTKFYGGSGGFSAKLTKDGNPLAGATVKFILSSPNWSKTAIYDVSTGADGFARLAINLYPGTYTIKTVFVNTYSKDNSITVKPAINLVGNDLTKIFGGPQGFSAQLNKSGNPLAGATVKFILSSVKWSKSASYDVLTGADGVARLAINLSPGTYAIKTVFTDADKKSYSTSNSITVKNFVSPIEIATSNLTKTYGGSEKFSAKLTDFGIPLANATIKFTVSSAKWSKPASYNVLTDVNGLASLAINLFTGFYTMDTSFVDSNNTTHKTSNSITVKALAPTIEILSSDLTKVYGGSEKFTAKLTEKGVPLTNKNVIFTIGSATWSKSVSYNVLTDSNGIASLAINLFTGNYDMKTTFIDSNKVTHINDNKITINPKPIPISPIKSLANQLFTSTDSKLTKAQKAYNYVRDEIGYSFYYDSKYYAEGTLEKGSANCCDQAHLLVALLKEAGISYNYVHGNCYFILSGNTYGHVWVEAFVDGKTYSLDTTSRQNSFNVIKNWNTFSYTFKGRYTTLPF